MMKSNPAIATATDDAPDAGLFWGLNSSQAAMLAGILVATAIVYAPSLRNGWFFDDWEVIVNNKLIHSWSFVSNSFLYDSWWFHDPRRLPQSAFYQPQSASYRPLENSWFALNAFVFDAHPAGWHLAKIVLHVVAVVLSFRVAQLLTGDVTIALLTGGIFAVMPAHVEAVVWASAIPELLATIFELGSLLFLIARRPGRSRHMIYALTLYACALLTHESAVLFPAIVGAYVFLIERGEGRNRGVAALRVSAPFVLLVIIYMCVRVKVLGIDHIVGMPHSETPDTIRGFLPYYSQHDRTAFLMTAPVVLLIYLGTLALPWIAGPAHNVEWITSASPSTLISAGILLFIAAVALALAWRSADRNLYLFCTVWILLTLAPAMNLNSIGALAHDRFLYGPSFGWSLAFALAATRIARTGPGARSIVGTAITVLLAAYVVSTIQAERFWHDDVTYYRQAVAVDPVDYDYHLRLHAALNKAGDHGGALEQLQRDVAIYPDDAYLRLTLARQYQTMGRELDFEREFQKFNELSTARLRQHLAAENSSTAQPVGEATTTAIPSP
jgi:protein O-mannosyl-transferase